MHYVWTVGSTNCFDAYVVSVLIIIPKYQLPLINEWMWIESRNIGASNRNSREAVLEMIWVLIWNLMDIIDGTVQQSCFWLSQSLW
jgi:hypothetical protein